MGQALPLAPPPRHARGFGAHMARAFGLPEPPTYVRRAEKQGMMALTEIKSLGALPDATPPLGHDDAYMLAVHKRSFERELWLDGKLSVAGPIYAGHTYIIDLRCNPRAFVRDPLHCIQFYLPLATLKAHAEQNDMPAFTELVQASSSGDDDAVMRHLAHAASATLAERPEASGYVLDAILNAVCAHTLDRYGTRRPGRQISQRGLAPWQERRAREVMEARLDASVAELAAECGLSTGYFSRAFKRSTGIAPHRWLIGRRIERAQALLTGSALSIVEIALGCGFSSQSHFHATFKRATGVSPGEWRRLGSCPVVDPGDDRP